MDYGYVYLIGEEGNEGRYKIGSTRARDINTRLKHLQTGNSNQLYIKNSYGTSNPFKMETMLHQHFKCKNVINEWFELSDEDVKEFSNTCGKFQDIIDALKDNPFF